LKIKKNIIAILGPDGSGKSTVIECLIKQLPDCLLFHHRPGLIPNISLIGKNEPPNIITEPHAETPHSPVLSALAFFYYIFDFTVGYFFKIKLNKEAKTLVVFDRYYYDYFVDKRRYRSSLSNGWYKFWLWMIPKPQFVFVLLTSPDLIHQRKQELTKVEIARQISELEKLCKNNQTFYKLDASKPPEELVGQIIKCVNPT